MRRFEFCCSQVHRDVVTMPFGFGRDKQSGCAVPTMVLSETVRLWLFLVVRGGIQFLERLGVQAPIAPNGITDTHPRTRASQEPKGHARDESRNGRVLHRRSSCLLFQMLGVETDSFLPNEQGDRRNLACQGEACH
jgi:hypothetical protein